MSLNVTRRALSSFPSRSVVRVLPDVIEALSKKRPVVALESTILAHGLPYPENLELVDEISHILRSKGVVPATVAIKDGECRVGLEREEISDLAIAGLEGRADKCSSRDLPFILARDSHNVQAEKAAKSLWGATTVASTMRLAHMAGISTFVTGGIGGVHRGGEVSMDISADLLELSRTPVVVVSAGIKSILDIGRTLEQLETLGVPTAAFGTNEYPAFFSPWSGVTAPARVDSADEVARAYWASTRTLQMPNGMLIAVPNTDPAGESVETAIREALIEAKQEQIIGRDVTPFILKRVAEMTGGDSLQSNTTLVKNNARVGADIAIAIAEQDRHTQNCYPLNNNHDSKKTSIWTPPLKSEEKSVSSTITTVTSRVIVVGGAVNDVVAKPKEGHHLIPATSNPGSYVDCDGGVGRNVAEVLGRLGAEPILYSAVGNDARGEEIISRLQNEYGVICSEETIRIIAGANTATYLAVLNSSGDLHVAVADMDIFHYIPTPSMESLRHADIILMDANPNVEYLEKVASSAVEVGTKVFLEPTSVPKATICGKNDDFLSYVTYAFPNVDELLAMADGCADTDTPNDINEASHDESFVTIKYAACKLLEKMRPNDDAFLIITMGDQGVLFASRKSSSQEEPEFKHFLAPEGVEVQNCTGAGDTLCGAFIKALLDGQDEETAISIGMAAALKSLKCAERTVALNLL